MPLDAKGDIPTYHKTAWDLIGVAIRAWYCAFGVPDLCLYGALATEPMFGESCSSYNVVPLTNHEFLPICQYIESRLPDSKDSTNILN